MPTVVPDSGTEVNSVPGTGTQPRDIVAPVSTRPRITSDYKRLLATMLEEVERSGVNVASDSGMGRTGVWRFKSDREMPSLAAAERIEAKWGLPAPKWLRVFKPLTK